MKNVILIGLGLFVSGCCGYTSDCGPTIGSLAVSLIDASTNDDLFINEILDSESIEVKNENGLDIDFQYQTSEDSIRGVIIILAQENPRPTYFQISVDSLGSANNLFVEINVATTDQSTRCCNYISVEILDVAPYEFQFNSEYVGLYDILID